MKLLKGEELKQYNRLIEDFGEVVTMSVADKLKDKQKAFDEKTKELEKEVEKAEQLCKEGHDIRVVEVPLNEASNPDAVDMWQVCTKCPFKEKIE